MNKSEFKVFLLVLNLLKLMQSLFLQLVTIEKILENITPLCHHTVIAFNNGMVAHSNQSRTKLVG